MCGAISPFPQYLFMAWCLVKHRDNFSFTFTLWSNNMNSEKRTSIWTLSSYDLSLLPTPFMEVGLEFSRSPSNCCVLQWLVE